ncbi:MAG: hypothetical protein Q8O22_00190 [Candidatus Omnitrophota bacterium]|nr:hypothetical protein [Candidatus Omnitrophota bacterium]
MSHKGLCLSCVHDRTCTFVRPAAVLQCEEFDSGIPVKNGRGTCCAQNAKRAALAPEEVFAE